MRIKIVLQILLTRFYDVGSPQLVRVLGGVGDACTT